MSEINGPSFNTMMGWYLENNMGEVSNWVARSLRERKKKVDEAEFISIVNYIMNDFEIRVEKFAKEEGMTLKDMYETLREEYKHTRGEQ